MSVDVYVVAQKKITTKDVETIKLYNGLIKNGYDVPDKIIEDIKNLGDFDQVYDEVHIPLLEVGKMTEVNIDAGAYDGNACYGDGLTLSLDKLPKNTKSIRIYMM